MPTGAAQSGTAGPAIFIVNLRNNFLAERPQHMCLEGIYHLSSVICHLSFGLKGRSLPLLLQKLIDIRGSDYVDACIHDGRHSFPLSQIVQDIDAFDAHCVWPLTDESVAFALF